MTIFDGRKMSFWTTYFSAAYTTLTDGYGQWRVAPGWSSYQRSPAGTISSDTTQQTLSRHWSIWM